MTTGRHEVADRSEDGVDSLPPSRSRHPLPCSRSLLEAAPDAIVAVDAHGRIALVNAQTERQFGYRRDELIGQRVEVLVPEALRGAPFGAPR